MCGRYALYGPVSRLRDKYKLDDCADLLPRYNIAPQSDVLVIRDHPEKGRVGVMHRWGLIPSWAKDASIGAKLNNARGETVADKPSFRTAFKRLRCLIPASGFYEWQAPPEGTKGRKQPYYISPNDETFLSMAGLVECWTSPEGERILSVCVITTGPNGVMAPIHDRMPVLLDAKHHDTWLDVKNHDVEFLKTLIAPAPESAVQAWPVSRLVSSAGNEGPELVRPLVEDAES